MVATFVLLLDHAAVSPATVVGVWASAVVPLPSSPYGFMPQHLTTPPWRTTQLSLLPAATAPIAVVMPLTAAGAHRSVPVPSPSCPEKLSPQQRIVPSASTAQVWKSPLLTATALVMPVTATGVVAVVRVPFPSCPLLL